MPPLAIREAFSKNKSSLDLKTNPSRHLQSRSCTTFGFGSISNDPSDKSPLEQHDFDEKTKLVRENKSKPATETETLAKSSSATSQPKLCLNQPKENHNEGPLWTPSVAILPSIDHQQSSNPFATSRSCLTDRFHRN